MAQEELRSAAEEIERLRPSVEFQAILMQSFRAGFFYGAWGMAVLAATIMLLVRF